MVLVAAILIAVSVGTGWSWGLFAWGVGVGVLGTACYQAMTSALTAVVRAHANAAGSDRFRLRLKYQRQIVLIGWPVFGCAFGIIAAALKSPWPDVFITASVLVFGVFIPAVLLVWLKRRAATLPDGPLMSD